MSGAVFALQGCRLNRDFEVRTPGAHGNPSSPMRTDGVGYGAGLRAGELTRLRVKHIDCAQNIICVEQSKGRKDRLVMLSPETLGLLREWLEGATDTLGHDGVVAGPDRLVPSRPTPRRS
jgi:integrase